MTYGAKMSALNKFSLFTIWASLAVTLIWVTACGGGGPEQL